MDRLASRPWPELITFGAKSDQPQPLSALSGETFFVQVTEAVRDSRGLWMVAFGIMSTLNLQHLQN